MKTYNVHLYVVTRVSIPVAASNDKEAIERAEHIFNADQSGHIRNSEYAEEIQEALIDELRDGLDPLTRAYSFDMGEIVPA